MPPYSSGYVLQIRIYTRGSKSNIRTLTACEYSFQDEQQGSMEPNYPVSHNSEGVNINTRHIFHRSITSLLLRKEEMDFSGIHLPSMKRLSGYSIYCCAKYASQEIFSSIKVISDKKKLTNCAPQLLSSLTKNKAILVLLARDLIQLVQGGSSLVRSLSLYPISLQEVPNCNW